MVNVAGGLEGGATVIDGVVDQLGGNTKRQDPGLAGTLVGEALSEDGECNTRIQERPLTELPCFPDPVADLLVNIGGGLAGTATVVDGVDSQLGNIKKR